MNNFIVRIYRTPECNGELFGVVEDVGTARKKAFHSASGLLSILMGNPGKSCKKDETNARSTVRKHRAARLLRDGKDRT